MGAIRELGGLPESQIKMGGSRADKELYFEKLKTLLDTYREFFAPKRVVVRFVLTILV